MLQVMLSGHGKERQNMVTARSEEGGQTNMRKEEVARTSTEDAIRKFSQENFILSTDRKHDPGRPRKRWLDV
jgi:hypothetical protein